MIVSLINNYFFWHCRSLPSGEEVYELISTDSINMGEGNTNGSAKIVDDEPIGEASRSGNVVGGDVGPILETNYSANIDDGPIPETNDSANMDDGPIPQTNDIDMNSFRSISTEDAA